MKESLGKLLQIPLKDSSEKKTLQFCKGFFTNIPKNNKKKSGGILWRSTEDIEKIMFEGILKNSMKKINEIDYGVNSARIFEKIFIK